MQDFAIFAERERAGWADPAVVGAYVDGFGPIVDGVARRIAEIALAGAPATLADLCCGQGTLTAMLSEKAAVTGVDFSPAMLARARQAAREATLVEGDALALPLPDSSFDVVTCNFGFLHTRDRSGALAEAARITKPGGTLIFSNWMPPEDNPVFVVVMGPVKANIDPAAAPPPAPDLFELARPEAADPKLAAAGLSLVARERIADAFRVPEAGDLFTIFAEGTVGMRMLIASQTEDRVARMRATVTERVLADFASNGGYAVPVNAMITVAKRG